MFYAKMKTNHERNNERGNALIYVLIAIVLFAALSFTMSRQSDTGEAGQLDGEQAEMYAAQLISYAAQTRQILEQMNFSGTDISEFDFILPSDGAFETPPNIHKVYHPDGGGLIPRELPPQVISQFTANPPPGWYLGSFNNVDWTASTGPEVILTAFQISRAVCERINVKITGSTAIPALSVSIKEVLIDDDTDDYGAGSNSDFTTGDICEECEGLGSLCVEDQATGGYAFYTVILDQ